MHRFKTTAVSAVLHVNNGYDRASRISEAIVKDVNSHKVPSVREASHHKSRSPSAFLDHAQEWNISLSAVCLLFDIKKKSHKIPQND